MRIPIAIFVTVVFLVGAASAQDGPPSYVSHGPCETGLPTYGQWFATTSLPSGRAYTASKTRQQQLLKNYSKLELQMTLEQVQALLGKPDFAAARAKGHLSNQPAPSKPICSNQIGYILQKRSENMADMEDVAIYLFFSPENKLTWAVPQNVPGLEPIGGPTK